MSTYNSYSSGMADRKLTISEFTGVNQEHGAYNGDYGSSPDAKNFISRYGRLYTCSGSSLYGNSLPQSSVTAENGRLFQAYFRDSDGNDITKVVLSVRGRLYVSDIYCQEWQMISGLFASDDWSMVNYRDESNDWLVMCNGVDDARYWDGVSETTVPLHPTQGLEELYFTKLTLVDERLWGGVSASHPDRIYWSNTFDPNDWQFNYETSENDGGGFVDIATFDGGRIRAVVSAFDDVLIFKDKTMHRLSGTYPGEFAVTQVYGAEGTLAPRSVVYNGTKLWFLSSNGLCVYNGTSVSSLADAGDRKLSDIWKRINPSSIYLACATLKDGVIYLALPLDGSAVNNYVVEYDTSTGYYSLVSIQGVDDWLVLREGQKETLLYLNGDSVYSYGVGYTFNGTAINAYWMSPVISCGSLSSKKSTGRIYLSINAQSLDVSRQPSVKITLTSGSKTRSKVIPLKNGVNELRKRVKIRGRTFRFMIENVNGDPLIINRGMEIRIEEDYD